ncbi:aspartyl-phosphate phosphatase Spo0E family protein [Virgibacillus sp. 179-BFC.A HS]|uniref:Aspartyl-phosphate phosphatase Spo0E family protein n=1 Tax=Tigheibacillus jepli TaxID=3035914 RepID=A0ABU5CKA0_9BACI|nr:aspartyl-phosphate phosphatase Spo0E family protein [Virgibacillus sp. 179-BFC.A HS]MDY0406787.1 aspartyl-phosphate phosphatase Spo0E family protein [Virgibacillus sp. 179-BFC.A HS]
MEYTRQMMYRAYENNPKDPRVLKISQSLDVLLNELSRQERKKEIEN